MLIALIATYVLAGYTVKLMESEFPETPKEYLRFLVAIFCWPALTVWLTINEFRAYR